MSRSCLSWAICCFCALLTAWSVLTVEPAASEKYIEYDFSNPEKVFALSLAESVAESGADPAALYKIMGAGQIVIVNDHPKSKKIPWMTTAGTVVNAPPELVYGVITDLDKYPQFMPQTEKAEAKKVNDRIDHVFYELGIPILFVTVDIPYSVYHYYQPPRRLDWIMAGGEFTANYGAYEVLTVPGMPTKSMLFYTSYSQPRNAMVSSMLKRIPMLDMMINLSTGTLVVKAIKERSQEIYKGTGGNVTPGASATLAGLLQQQPQTLAKLAGRGKLIIIEDTKPAYYSGGALIKGSPAEIFEQLRQLDKMSGISESWEIEYLSKDDQKARAEIETVMDLTFEFESEYIVDYDYQPPNRITFKGEDGGDLEGVAGSWELVDAGGGRTLVFYRNTSDLQSQGFMMRRLLGMQPSFEMAIQASQTQYMISDVKRWCEASPQSRLKMIGE